MNLNRFIVRPLSGGGLYLILEEVQGLRSGGLRRFAAAVLFTEIAIIVSGCVNAAFFKVPLLFAYAQVAESAVWGSYFVLVCMAAAVVLDRRLVAIATLSGNLSTVRRRWFRPIVEWRTGFYGLALVVGLAGYLGYAQSAHVNRWPPGRPAAIQIIENDIELRPGRSFRGRVFTATATSKANDAVLKYKKVLGNDFFTDLLAYNIPTINEYQQWTSPIYFYFLRSFFGNEEDGFDKSSFLLSGFDGKIARMIGVRYVVNNKPMADGELVHSQAIEDIELRLYRLDNVNLGQWSPTHPVYYKSAAEAVALMRAARFVPERDVLVEEPLVEPIVAAEGVRVVAEKGSVLHVNAKTSGKSLVLLPFEFSHCLRLHVPPGQRAKIIPVNLVQTGLVFDGQVDVTIDYAFGVFVNRSCRHKDIERADHLGVKGALRVVR